jgi:hypothetical protein
LLLLAEILLSTKEGKPLFNLPELSRRFDKRPPFDHWWVKVSNVVKSGLPLVCYAVNFWRVFHNYFIIVSDVLDAFRCQKCEKFRD